MADEPRVTEKARQQLARDLVCWLTTVRPDGQPQSSLVWFWSEDGTAWIRSQPGTPKVRNVDASPRVGIHLNSDSTGGTLVALEGRATVVAELPDDVRVAYLGKYGRQIRADLHTTYDGFLADYSVTIRVQATRVRSW